MVLINGVRYYKVDWECFTLCFTLCPPYAILFFLIRPSSFTTILHTTLTPFIVLKSQQMITLTIVVVAECLFVCLPTNTVIAFITIFNKNYTRKIVSTTFIQSHSWNYLGYICWYIISLMYIVHYIINIIHRFKLWR